MTSQMLGGEQGTDVEYVVTDDGVEPPVVEFGRLPTGTVSARAVYDNGVVEPISLGLNHFYLYEPSPSRHSRLATRQELQPRDRQVA